MFNFLYQQELERKKNLEAADVQTTGFVPFKLKEDTLPSVYDTDISALNSDIGRTQQGISALNNAEDAGEGLLGGAKNAKLAGIIGTAGNILGSFGEEDKVYADGTNAVSGLDQGTHQGYEGVKDGIASLLGPWGQAFRGLEKGGKALGGIIGGDDGASFAQGFLDPASNFMRDDFSFGEKLLTAVSPIGGGLLTRKKNKERRQEAMEEFQDNKFELAKLRRLADYNLQEGNQVSPADITQIKEKLKYFQENKNAYHGQ